MQSFSSFLFSNNTFFNSRCHCYIRVLTDALAPSSVWTGCWQRQVALSCRLVPQKITCKFSPLNILSLARIKCCKYEIIFWYLFHKSNTQINKTNSTGSKLKWEFQISLSIGKYQVHIQKTQLVKCWECLIEFS